MTNPLCSDVVTAAGELRKAADACERRHDFDAALRRAGHAVGLIVDVRDRAKATRSTLSLDQAKLRARICKRNLAVMRGMAAKGEHVSPRYLAHQVQQLDHAQAVIDAQAATKKRKAVAA